MKTHHQIYFSNAANMKEVDSKSVQMVCTSSIYPLIEMWDTVFSQQNSKIKETLDNGEGKIAFELMNRELDKIWNELYRVLIPGGIACINIGDATRTFHKNFQLYSNHARFLQHLMKIGFQILPEIIWRKQTNAPNKFMGSGMFPPGAYVTLEHEFILIVRKGGKREFKSEQEKLNRQQSGYFWEERNIWFSDLWDFKGIGQDLKNEKTRERSAAYPFELAYRLINMFSVRFDTILDPFLGTSTTTIAAMTSVRHSIGYEIDPSLKAVITKKINNSLEFSNNYIENRIKNHISFINERKQAEKPLKYTNSYYGFPVVSNQEIKLFFNKLKIIKQIRNNKFVTFYDQESDGKNLKIKPVHKSQKDLLQFF